MIKFESFSSILPRSLVYLFIIYLFILYFNFIFTWLNFIYKSKTDKYISRKLTSEIRYLQLYK